ncbi:PREDICTED: spermatogenesis- and oogenesis-specific basic helix-loop-helix-containing protein 1 [Galeopterus variegatus]|uniref:Spermatogenesis- and oogenesis-specific basic helix-loop-helix-containing protein 1 n=1 Tax=Galeopterus variegatus TaxID=482537 RepID=A0ABM0S3Y5_GALVR|nr:PREDICTED: spermatogenesis- and oogenesis-specific basic helix-loop-helix-containing protein 1 [Galeopterus variegatus]
MHEVPWPRGLQGEPLGGLEFYPRRSGAFVGLQCRPDPSLDQDGHNPVKTLSLLLRGLMPCTHITTPAGPPRHLTCSPGQPAASSGCLGHKRKRISVSCERLRDLLPRFDGRREDMVSVLEMAVQYLRLAHALVPGRGRRTVLASSEETWQAWQTSVLQLALSSQVPAGRPDSGTGVSGVTLQQDPLSCATPGVDECEGLSQWSEVLDRPPALPGQGPYNAFTWVSVGPWVCRKCGDIEELGPVLVTQPTTSAFGCRQWRFVPRPPTSPDMSSSEAAPSWLVQAGPVGGGAAPVTGPAEESEETLTPVPGDRSAWGSDVEDGTSLLTASPEWLLGSLETRGDGAPAWAPARSSSPDRAEMNFLGDSQPDSQELQDGPLEPWDSDAGRVGLSLRDEVDILFPDFFAC